MASPFVSIIVPIYNGADYLDTFFSCLNKQSYSDYEVILVDDGSKDDTYEKSSLLAQNDPRIKLYKKENGGPGSARNYGIERAGGKYVAFFDIDDEFDENVLKDNVQFVLEDDLDIVMWNFTMVVLSTGGKYYRQIGRSHAADRNDFFQNYLIPTLDNEMFNPPWNKLIKRSLLLDNNIRFRTEYHLYEDILFNYEICKKANSVAVNDNSYYTYIIKSKGSLLTKFHPECFDAILAIYKSAMEYGTDFEHNERQINRFKQQFIYLTRGYIKQICVNKQIGFMAKKEALSKIGDNPEFRAVSKEVDNGIRRLPAKSLMRFRLYGCMVVYYNMLDAVKSKR